MSRHLFEREQFIPSSLDQAWNFFSDPRNLCRITPPELDFRVISKVPDRITEGLKIEYHVRPLFKVPLKWVSLIQNIEAPYRFEDIQLKGPYLYWQHVHIFKEVPGGILMKDIIHYEAPLEWLFPWINEAVVLKQLNHIFDFRRRALEGLF